MLTLPPALADAQKAAYEAEARATERGQSPGSPKSQKSPTSPSSSRPQSGKSRPDANLAKQRGGGPASAVPASPPDENNFFRCVCVVSLCEGAGVCASAGVCARMRLSVSVCPRLCASLLLSRYRRHPPPLVSLLCSASCLRVCVSTSARARSLARSISRSLSDARTRSLALSGARSLGRALSL